MTIETHAADQSDTNDTEEMFGILVSVVKNNDCKPLGEKESDEAVWELSLAMKECHEMMQKKVGILLKGGLQWKKMTTLMNCWQMKSMQ